MRFSLIVATLGRVEELRRLFVSLSEQTYRNFEIILVDQNTDDRLLPLVSDYSRCFCLEHIHSAKGLSKARNVGMKYVSGDVIAFPDDDCWYDSDLLQRLAAMFPVNSGWAGITGRAVDQNGDPTSGRWDRRTGVITPGNVWRRAISFSIFLRTSVAVMHHFDETLGVGAETPWGAGEETDFLLRVIEAGNQVH
jgi:glycosyltransferase involved in cell wall biosynthesis